MDSQSIRHSVHKTPSIQLQMFLNYANYNNGAIKYEPLWRLNVQIRWEVLSILVYVVLTLEILYALI